MAGYVVEALLGIGKTRVAELLARGVYKRYGGVIRVAPGHPKAGTLVAMLRDVAPRMSSLPANPMQAMSSLFANVQLGQIQSQLGTILQLTNVAAAASVLNLGVSAVGFVIMARKLDRLQSSVNQVLNVTTKNHDEAMGKLATIEHHLVELAMMGAQHGERLAEALVSARQIRRDLLDGYLARMLAKLEHLPVQPTDAQARAAWEVFTEVRHWTKAGLDGAEIRNESAAWFDVLLRFRVWAFAVTSEVSLARRVGAMHDAASLAGDAAEHARRWTGEWQRALMPPDQFFGAFRFEHPRFEHILRETRTRLLRLQFGVEPLAGDLRGVRAARELAEQAPALGEAWFAQQHHVATVVDMMTELTERLEGIAAQTRWCVERRLEFGDWEALPDPAESDGIAVIDVEDR